ncbi:MAG: hypothetical protein L6R42_002512 [Xanthoria sp. 1 TBL-2021]|nr:MAG: hypothetical protein L6R42_002512 [Xanthoria sp. 1 TBL-2021]
MSTIKAPGILHRYTTNLVAFEHTRDGISPNNSLLFVGGLNQGFLTIPYAQDLAAALPPSYSFVEVLLSSAFSGWGHSSISQDVYELGQCVEYFQSLRPGGKVVLMGNSTGCQDVLCYLSYEGSRPKVDGGILQAPVSDREAIQMIYPAEEYKRYNEMAQQRVKEGKGDHMLPNEVSLPLLGARVTADRWLSLASPAPEHAGEDDLFSSDLGDGRFRSTFGMAGKRGVALLILFSGNDGFVPKAVDKQALVARMEKAFVDAGGQLGGGSGVLLNASHTVKDVGEARDELLKRVKNFVDSIDKGTLRTN